MNHYPSRRPRRVPRRSVSHLRQRIQGVVGEFPARVGNSLIGRKHGDFDTQPTALSPGKPSILSSRCVNFLDSAWAARGDRSGCDRRGHSDFRGLLPQKLGQSPAGHMFYTTEDDGDANLAGGHGDGWRYPSLRGLGTSPTVVRPRSRLSGQCERPVSGGAGGICVRRLGVCGLCRRGTVVADNHAPTTPQGDARKARG